MINVLVVDDDAMVAELNRCYIGQLEGFHCTGVASTLQQAKEMALHGGVDLILLDIYLQQESGLDLLPALRQAKQAVDAIVISSAADADTVRQSLHYGVVDYLIKPFQFSRFEEALTGWRRDLFGDKALALKAGRVGLSVARGRVVTIERDAPPAP